MMDQAGCNGIRDEYIEEVAQEILSMGINNVSKDNFDFACAHCGIEYANFTQLDLDHLQERLCK